MWMEHKRLKFECLLQSAAHNFMESLMSIFPRTAALGLYALDTLHTFVVYTKRGYTK